MNFLCYHQDREGAAHGRVALRDDHWSYMDRFAEQLIARGPTFGADGSVTGSMHIVQVADAAAARSFALDEPYYQAGVFRDVLLRRWENLTGRTMWQFPDPREDARRYFVLGLGGHRVMSSVTAPEVIAAGPLVSDDGIQVLGAAALVQVDDPSAARGVLSIGDGSPVEVHRWDFGGRPAQQ